MDGYKKIIKNQELRYEILSKLRFVPDETMLKAQYFIKFKRALNLKNPVRFTEKMQWYKLFYKNSLLPVCSDKFTVRDYIRSKNLDGILNELYCVFDSPEEIDLEKLPSKFVLKLSNGSGTNVICRDKSSLDREELAGKFENYIRKVNANLGREWPYLQSKPVIIAEKLLEDADNADGSITDYKIFCYDGKPAYIICTTGRYTDNTNHLYYDAEWNKLQVVSENADISADVEKPENLQELLRIAEILSEDFPFVRVDLYSIQNKITFGELTFFPWSGYMEFEPDSFDFELGEKFILPQKID